MQKNFAACLPLLFSNQILLCRFHSRLYLGGGLVARHRCISPLDFPDNDEDMQSRPRDPQRLITAEFDICGRVRTMNVVGVR